jgi:uncharacterized lipoprotein YddW (UPF0748 family)
MHPIRQSVRLMRKLPGQPGKGWLSRRGRPIVLGVLVGWLVICLWQAPVVPVGKVGSAELRGIWMTNVGAALMYYTTRLDEVVANLAQHRLNTLYPAVWNRGETLHPSPIAEQAGAAGSLLPILPGQDVLAGLVTQAHRQHLRLIPWFEYGLMIPAKAAIAQAHPDWLTMTQTGETVADPVEPVRQTATPPNGRPKLNSIKQSWLNPAHPEVQQFLTALIGDVARRYPVEGIQLDDHFGLPIEFGYDPYTVKLYQATHRGQSPPKTVTDPEWMAWRADRLTELMAKITAAVKAVRPSAIVSLSPNDPDYAYRTTLQDWRLWVKQGLVDEVVVQVYRPNMAALQAVLQSDRFQRLPRQVPISIGLYTGPFLDAKPMEDLQAEVKTVRGANYAGVSFFSWETTLWLFKGDSAERVKRGFLSLFPQTSGSPS